MIDPRNHCTDSVFTFTKGPPAGWCFEAPCSRCFERLDHEAACFGGWKMDRSAFSGSRVWQDPHSTIIPRSDFESAGIDAMMNRQSLGFFGQLRAIRTGSYCYAFVFSCTCSVVRVCVSHPQCRRTGSVGSGQTSRAVPRSLLRAGGRGRDIAAGSCEKQ